MKLDNQLKKEVKPFLKWAGGKTQLLDQLTMRLPLKFKRYFEPFIGGGALLFYLKPKYAFINDINKALINTYIVIRDDYEKLIDYITKLDRYNEINETYYLSIRDMYNYHLRNNYYNLETAGLMIWLNKHCFNGLYRVNSNGEFNVPWSNGKSKSIDPLNITRVGKYLKKITISNIDFEEFVKNCRRDDFVYFDPPYMPESKTANFTSYNQNNFGVEEHLRLAKVFKELSQRKVFCMLSNSNTDFVKDLYKDFNIDLVEAKRSINVDSTKRTTKELIITNYTRF